MSTGVKIFFGIVLLQVLYLGVTSAIYEQRLTTGTPILLETVPVDPRDLLRGDYVILRYKISTIPKTLFDPPLLEEDQPFAGQEIYVALERRGEFHEAVQAAFYPMDAAPGQVVVRGTVEDQPWQSDIAVAYGVERYYVREGTGNPEGTVTVEAVVSWEGVVQIKQVFVDGAPYSAAMK